MVRLVYAAEIYLRLVLLRRTANDRSNARRFYRPTRTAIHRYAWNASQMLNSHRPTPDRRTFVQSQTFRRRLPNPYKTPDSGTSITDHICWIFRSFARCPLVFVHACTYIRACVCVCVCVYVFVSVCVCVCVVVVVDIVLRMSVNSFSQNTSQSAKLYL